MSIDKCLACRSKSMANLNLRGRSFPYKSFPAITLTLDLYAPTCTKCGNSLFNDEILLAIDNSLEATIKMQMKCFIEQSLEINQVTQKQLAETLGFTEVYVSKMKKGKITPDLKTYNLFKLISSDASLFSYLKTNDLVTNYIVEMPHKLNLGPKREIELDVLEDEYIYGVAS